MRFMSRLAGAFRRPAKANCPEGGSRPTCARCGRTFEWMEGYLAQETPGRGEPPPGVGHWGPRVYCPDCGALVAEMQLPLDEEEWIWFGENALVNEGVPDPPSYGLFGWREIPLHYLPIYEEHELDVEAVRAYERQQQAEPAKQGSAEPAPWKEAFDEAGSAHQSGSRAAALEALKRAVALGLPEDLHADALAGIGIKALLEGDLEEAFRLCRESVMVSTTLWQAHSVLAMIYIAKGDRDAANREHEETRRYAGTKSWDPETERRLIEAAKRLAGQR